MGRVSTKENKTVYQISREALGYSREKASEVLGWISPERIEKIENEKSPPRSDEVLELSIGYKNPNLCNHYCAKECPIGQQYVPEVKIEDLSQIVLEMLASLNAMHKKQERLIEITADGQITGDEIQDFIHIQEELEKISITAETLQLWSEQKHRKPAKRKHKRRIGGSIMQELKFRDDPAAMERLMNAQNAIDEYVSSHPKKLSETERDELGELLKERAAALSEATGFEVHSIVD